MKSKVFVVLFCIFPLLVWVGTNFIFVYTHEILHATIFLEYGLPSTISMFTGDNFGSNTTADPAAFAKLSISQQDDVRKLTAEAEIEEYTLLPFKTISILLLTYILATLVWIGLAQKGRR